MRIIIFVAVVGLSCSRKAQEGYKVTETPPDYSDWSKSRNHISLQVANQTRKSSEIYEQYSEYAPNAVYEIVVLVNSEADSHWLLIYEREYLNSNSETVFFYTQIFEWKNGKWVWVRTSGMEDKGFDDFLKYHYNIELK